MRLRSGKVIREEDRFAKFWPLLMHSGLLHFRMAGVKFTMWWFTPELIACKKWTKLGRRVTLSCTNLNECQGFNRG